MEYMDSIVIRWYISHRLLHNDPCLGEAIDWVQSPYLHVLATSNIGIDHLLKEILDDL